MVLAGVDGVDGVNSIDVKTAPGLTLEEAALAAKKFGLTLQGQLGQPDGPEVLFKHGGRTHNADDIDTSSLEP
jgi:hypothetical protein